MDMLLRGKTPLVEVLLFSSHMFLLLWGRGEEKEFHTCYQFSFSISSMTAIYLKKCKREVQYSCS